MTVIAMIGRRRHRNPFRGAVQVLNGVFAFQEHMWIIINSSFNMAKKQAKESDKNIAFIVTKEKENEDLIYCIEWIKIVVQGTEEQEQEEYDEFNKMYEQCGKIIKKDLNIGSVDNNMKQHFKTKMLNLTELKDAYEKGYGATRDNSISQKLLELGILTHLKIEKDYENRDMTRKQDIGV